MTIHLEPIITSEEHIRTAEYFLLESDREFDAGERLQASEKLWGAAAHSVIAVAQKLDWPASKHGQPEERSPSAGPAIPG